MKFDRERVFLSRLDDYAYVVRTTDLGSSCGAEGLVLCEIYSIYLGDNERNERAIESAAWFDPSKHGNAYKRQLAMALVDYGYGTCKKSFVIQVSTTETRDWEELLTGKYGKGREAYYAAWRELCDYARCHC